MANVIRFLRKVAMSVKRWPMLCDFSKGGQVRKKVANVIRFLQKVAKSVKRSPLNCDFCRRWPSLKCGLSMIFLTPPPEEGLDLVTKRLGAVLPASTTESPG